MSEEFKEEIIIRESSFTLDGFLNQSFIPQDLLNDLKKANALFIPRIEDDKPFFEVVTQDLFYFLKQNENENFKVDICIKDEDFQYIRTEAEEVLIALGIIHIERNI